MFVGTAPANAGNPFKSMGASLAKARTGGGLNYVVVDPVLGHSDNLATKDRGHWVPIIPGTDAALAMGMIGWIIETKRYDEKFLTQPNGKTAEAAGEFAWSNATHLVIVEKGHPREGAFLRGSDIGMSVPEADKYKDADSLPRATFRRTAGRDRRQARPGVLLDAARRTRSPTIRRSAACPRTSSSDSRKNSPATARKRR